MAISAKQVMDLRKATGLGMMDCKKALNDADGDMELAIDNLRKKGQATAAKRADREANEGKVSVMTLGDDTVLWEVNSETDFVSRNDDFVDFANTLGEVLLETKPADKTAALAAKSDKIGGLSVEEKTLEYVGKIGEKIALNRFKIISADKNSERVVSYIHGDGKIGVLVTVGGDSADAVASDAAELLGKDIAMQVAAVNPVSVSREDVDADLVSKEREIYLEQIKSSGKPEKIWDKIVEGKMNKFFKQSVLLEQDFIKDPDITVTQRAEAASKEAAATLTIKSFVRIELGA